MNEEITLIKKLRMCGFYVKAYDEMNREDELQGIIDFQNEEIKKLKKLCTAGKKALRSYQYGNASIDLAEEVADKIETVVK